MKKVTFNEEVKIYRFDEDNNHVTKFTRLQKDLSLEQQYKVNFHYLVIHSIFKNGPSSIRSKNDWWNYLRKHPSPLEARYYYHKHMLNCLYKLSEDNIYNMYIYYNNHLVKKHLPYYCDFLNIITILGIKANKIIKFYRKYKSLTNRTVKNNYETE